MIGDERNIKKGEPRTRNGHPSRSSQMYRIRNKDGLIFSQFEGWQPLNDELHGHCFDKHEVQTVADINGFARELGFN